MKRCLLFGALLLMGYAMHAQPMLGYAHSLGGVNYQSGSFVSTDIPGNVYATGQFTGTTDFDPSPSVYNITSASTNDVFITKFSLTGQFRWAKSIGGPGVITIHSQAVDSISSLYLLCRIASGTADVDPGPGVTLLSASASNVLIKIDSSGNLRWARELATSAEGIAADRTSVYLAGSFQGTADFDPGPGVFTLTAASVATLYLSKLDSAGNFQWAKNMGGASQQFMSITLNSSGIYTSGTYAGTADFDPGTGTVNLTSSGSRDLFITKSDPLGNLLWAKTTTGTGQSTPAFTNIKTNSAGEVFAAGTFSGTIDFDPGMGTSNLTGNDGMYFMQLDASGNFKWAKGLAGPATRLSSIAVDDFQVYATGRLSGTEDFDPGPVVYNLTTAGALDFFVLQLGIAGDFRYAQRFGGSQNDAANSISINRAGGVVVTGFYNGTVNFSPGPGVFNLTSAGVEDAYILKLLFAVPLPLKLTSFTANRAGNDDVELRWQTQSELNTSRFEVERSTDGRTFAICGSLGAANSHSQAASYTLNDRIAGLTAGTKTLHYRLKMVDKDGSYTYTQIVAVKLNAKQELLQILQNPVVDALKMQVSGTGETITLSIIDNGGRTLKQQSVNANGTTSLTMQVSSLTSGTYHLVAQSANGIKQVVDFIKL